MLELAQQALARLSLHPLYGGGFWVAMTQLTVFYYIAGAILHFVVPRFVSVKNIQVQSRKQGEVQRDAIYSLGKPGCLKISLLAVTVHHATITNSPSLRVFSCYPTLLPELPPHSPPPQLIAAIITATNTPEARGLSIRTFPTLPPSLPPPLLYHYHTTLWNFFFPLLLPSPTTGPLAVKAAVWTVVEQLHSRGWGLTYGGPVRGLPQLAYCLLCVCLLDFLHDGWFYWTHRLLHWGPLYRHVHYIHHKSKAPSAFTGYSFHLAEALLVFANEVLVCWLLPLHMGLHRTYHLLTTLIHEGGHAGYELAPFIPTLEGLITLLLRGVRPCAALNTVQHHDLHHRYPTRHFSLYFTHWDRWCGSLHPAYYKDLFSYF
ncbi:hypothetical protein Agub_g3089 [Astrephomene gubernaculifera]|uniref:Fatty acid hydroxylase domain-containing protein n=1 Tax=Astrephomene gubernaculifera TaxID=47775 RepID=A0AAD3HIS5_9CHLO|nr:hypothetical protein Agub_g3089 [Astrephomene gubernaculifera]